MERDGVTQCPWTIMAPGRWWKEIQEKEKGIPTWWALEGLPL